MPNFSSALPASLITGRSVSDPIRIPTVTPKAPSPAVTLKPPVVLLLKRRPKPRSGHHAELSRPPPPGTTNHAARAILPAALDGFHPSSSTAHMATLSPISCRQYAGAGQASNAENPSLESSRFLSQRQVECPVSAETQRP